MSLWKPYLEGNTLAEIERRGIEYGKKTKTQN